VFEAWALLGAQPSKSRTFGLRLREQLKSGGFACAELARLLAAMAQLRGALPSYRPNQYDVADICGGLLTADLRGLPAPCLASGGAGEGWGGAAAFARLHGWVCACLLARTSSRLPRVTN
jgi:hypothetical protein